MSMFSNAIISGLDLTTWAAVNVIASLSIALVLIFALVKFIDPADAGKPGHKALAYLTRAGVAFCSLALLGNAFDSAWAVMWPSDAIPAGEIAMNAALALTLGSALGYALTDTE
jgi:ABC-type transport system involved in cytochrome c biogenesis permease subunit